LTAFNTFFYILANANRDDTSQTYPPILGCIGMKKSDL